MKDNKILRNILLSSLSIMIIIPLSNLYFTYSLFNKLVIENSKEKANLVALQLKTMLIPMNTELTKDDISEGLVHKIEVLKGDHQFVKLEIFSKSGEILYHPNPKKTGVVYKEGYFHEIVAKGNTYSKVISKDTGYLVETYIPLMVDGKFKGAVEIYYDITTKRRMLNDILRWSILISVALISIIAAFVTLFIRANRNNHS